MYPTTKWDLAWEVTLYTVASFIGLWLVFG